MNEINEESNEATFAQQELAQLTESLSEIHRRKAEQEQEHEKEVGNVLRRKQELLVELLRKWLETSPVLIECEYRQFFLPIGQRVDECRRPLGITFSATGATKTHEVQLSDVKQISRMRITETMAVPKNVTNNGFDPGTNVRDYVRSCDSTLREWLLG